MVVGTRRSSRLKAAESNSVSEGSESSHPKSTSKSCDQAGINTDAAQGTCKTAGRSVVHKGKVASDSSSPALSSKREKHVGKLTEKIATSESVQSAKTPPDSSRQKHASCHGDEESNDVAEEKEMDPSEVRRLHEEIAKNAKEAYKKESIMKRQMKGRPKSGRKWKTEQTARFSDLRKDKPLKSSWQLKMAQKAEKLSVRKYQQELLDARREAVELKKQRREEHRQRREENQKKSEVVQVIRNTAKLKRMKKKQLRLIEKR
ncbi:uncharacterized protein [Diadema setosum]|uniref:uncharacterized protein n=1 Tax=Diadema setosum TaxID=31175 RepID=UPI003B3A7474